VQRRDWFAGLDHSARQGVVLSLVRKHFNAISDGSFLHGCGSEMGDESNADVLQRRGAMLTWNGSWFEGRSDVDSVMRQGWPIEAKCEHLRQLDGFPEFFERFRQFVIERARFFRVQHWSLQVELSPHAERAGRVHVHAFVHFDHSGWLGLAHDWKFDGSTPFLKFSEGKGRGATALLHRGHYYLQMDKLGFLYRSSNFRKGSEFVVDPRWTVQLYALRKLGGAALLDGILDCRGRVRGIYQDMAWLIAKEKEQEEEAMLREVHQAEARQLRPFRVLPAVEEWARQFKAPEDGGPSPPLLRFKFLVLTGDSRFGKSLFAQHLFPPALVVPCQGAPQPNMREWDRSKYKSVVFDEVSWETIVGSKALFQSNSTKVVLGQSPVQGFTYSVLLHRVPLVCTMNDWLLSARRTRDKEKISWLMANSIVVNVDAPLWVE
jgi:hypothetical protein